MVGAMLAMMFAVGCDAAGPTPTTGNEYRMEILTGSGDFRTETLDLPGLGVQSVTYELVDGQAVFQGDMILDLERLRVSDVEAARSAGRRNEAARWIGGVVPYTIDSTLASNDARVSGAISSWQSTTGITFIPRTSQGDYVLFRNPSGNTSCVTSNIGRTTGVVAISLATGCSTGNAIHEVGHAVGLWHEQSRADRDTWVTVNWANIQSGMASQFNTYLQNSSDGVDSSAYDFGSVMAYDSFAFSANGLPTLVKKDGSTFTSQRSGLSANDVRGVGRMYPRFPAFDTDPMPTIQSNFGPTITSWGRDRLDVLAIATDGSLRHQYSNNGGATWSGWVDNWGGVAISGVDAVSWGPNRIDAVAKGTNNSIWHFWYDSGTLGWEDLGMQMKFDPGISSWGSGNLDIFCVGTDNSQKHRAYRPDGWHGWENLGGILTAGIDAVSWGVNRIDMVSRNSNSKVVHKAWDGSWSSWTDRGGSLSGSTPTIASHASGHFDIFASFVDGNVWKRSYELAWELDFGKVGGALSEPDAVSDDAGRFDMVGLLNGNVRHASIRNN